MAEDRVGVKPVESKKAGADQRLATTAAVAAVFCSCCSQFGEAFNSVEIRCCAFVVGAKAPADVVDKANKHEIAPNEIFIIKKCTGEVK